MIDTRLNVFIFSLCSSKSYQVPLDCILQIHQIPIAFIYFFEAPYRFKHHQNASFRYIVFNLFSEVTNRFKHRQSACFREIVFKIFSEVTNRFRKCLPYFESCICSSINIISNSIRMYHFTVLVFKVIRWGLAQYLTPPNTKSQTRP